MKKDKWLKDAKALHQVCLADINGQGKGGTRISRPEATKLQELQSAIGSNHGRKDLTYKQVRASLDEMFDMVKAGQKDNLLK